MVSIDCILCCNTVLSCPILSYAIRANWVYACLSLSVRPRRGGMRETGHIFLVKNRLPPEMMEDQWGDTHFLWQ